MTQDNHRRILVAADDPGALESLVSVLSRTPHTIRSGTAQQGRAWVESGEHFDLALVSIDPPELAGFAVVRALRQEGCPECPVLAFSGSFKRQHIEGMLENMGIRRLFPREIDAQELLFWVNYSLFPEDMRSRRSPRLPASLALSLVEGTEVLRGRACNLSEDGLFLETRHEVPCGSQLDLRFRLPGRGRGRGDIQVRCEVVWASRAGIGGEDAPCGLGLRFLSLDERSRQAIKTYVMAELMERSI